MNYKTFFMQEMPIKPKDCIGCILQLKQDATEFSVTNFGREEYVFDISAVNPDLPLRDRIRLSPVDEHPKRVHVLAIMLGYEGLRERFEIVKSTGGQQI